MKSIFHRRAFTLLEIVVILGIIALFLALLVPFAVRAREGGRSAACAKNMTLIGKSISAYTADNDGRLPGPLTMDQYPVDAAGMPPRDGQLLKHITSHLTAFGGARAAFTYPGWQKAQRATDSAVFLVNVDPVAPFDQPIWGEMAGTKKGPLKIEDIGLVRFKRGDQDVTAKASEVWALTEADQMLAKILGAEKEDGWMLRLPAKAVHVSYRNALYFDWHVGKLTLTNSSVAPPTTD
jgi:prepilin-type processing-associated H-X9-DG protein